MNNEKVENMSNAYEGIIKVLKTNELSVIECIFVLEVIKNDILRVSGINSDQESNQINSYSMDGYV